MVSTFSKISTSSGRYYIIIFIILTFFNNYPKNFPLSYIATFLLLFVLFCVILNHIIFFGYNKQKKNKNLFRLIKSLS